MLEELRNLKSGELQMWRRQHRGEILQYLEEHNEAEAMERYRFFFKAAFRRFVDHEPPVRFRCDRFTKQDKCKLLSEMAIAGTRENQKEIRELKEAYQAFVEQVGEDLNKKLFLPLLRFCVKLDNPMFDLPPDKLNLDEFFGDKLEKPLELSSPSGPDVMAEAEAILSPVEPGGLEERLHATWCKLYDLYIEACQSENWGDALVKYQWMRELDCIREDEEGDEFIEDAEEWLARAEKPDELYICY